MSHYYQQYRQNPFPFFPTHQSKFEEEDYFFPVAEEENVRRFNHGYHTYRYYNNDYNLKQQTYYNEYYNPNMPRRKASSSSSYNEELLLKQYSNKLYRRESQPINKQSREELASRYERNFEVFNNYTAKKEPHYYYCEQQSVLDSHYQRLNGVRSVSPRTKKRSASKNRRNSKRDMFEREEMTRRNLDQSWVHPANNALSFVAQPPMMRPMTPNYGLGVGVTAENWFSQQQQLNNNNRVLFMPQPMVPMVQPSSSSHFMPDCNKLLYPPQEPPPSSLIQYPFLANSNTNNMILANLLHQQIQQQQHSAASTTYPINNNSLLAVPADSNNNSTMTNSGIDLGSGFSSEEGSGKSRSVTPSSYSVKSEPRNSISNSPNIAMHQPQQQLIKRRRSLMENILSSFSLLGEPELNYTVRSSDNAKLTSSDTRDPPKNSNIESAAATPNKMENNKVTSPVVNTDINPAVVSSSDIKRKNNIKQSSTSLSRRSSLKLYQKANALQNRDYIWCFRPLQKLPTENEKSLGSLLENEKKGKWAAFDIENQYILDLQYSVILTKKTNTQYGPKNGYINILQNVRQENNTDDKPDLVTTNDPSLIVTLNRQSNLPSAVVVSVQDGIAWYSSKQQTVNNDNNMNNENDKFSLLEIAYMPTRLNKLVVSKESFNEQEEMSSNSFNNNNQINRSSLKRSKSLDGRITNKLLNTILSW